MYTSIDIPGLQQTSEDSGELMRCGETPFRHRATPVIHSEGISQPAGDPPWIIPRDRGILLATFAFSRLLPSAFERLQRLQRLRKWPFVLRLFERWTWHGTACVIGKFCQVTFPTMANVGLSPMMCYRHPGSKHFTGAVLAPEVWRVLHLPRTPETVKSQ